MGLWRGGAKLSAAPSADRLGFSRLEYQRLEAMARAEAGHRWRSRADALREAREEYSVDDAFAILNLTAAYERIREARGF